MTCAARWAVLQKSMLGLEDQLGSIIKYLLKHSEHPVCVLPPEPELPDSA